MDTLKQSMESMTELFQKQMEEFHAELKKREVPVAVSTSSLAADFSIFRDFMMKALSTLQTQVTMLAKEQDRLEMRGRRKILLFHGVKEQDGENLNEAIVKVATGTLNISNFSISDISRCHRMGKPDKSKPRPILVKLKDTLIRDKLWFGKTSLKGTGITLSEFLTRERHVAFMEARQSFGLSKCWTRDGYIFIVGPDGTRYKVTSVAELHSIPKPHDVASGVSTSSSKEASKTLIAKVKRTTRK